MTRQKKEILRHIDEIQMFIAADEALGCGFAPAGFYDELYEQMYALETELARLSGYESMEEMYMDERGCRGSRGTELPFV
jgi:hypothetical protein